MLVRQKSMNSVLNPKGGHESKKFEKLEQKTSRQSSLVSLMDSSADNHSTTRLGSFTGGSSSSSSSSSTNNTGGGNSPNHNQSYSERLMNQPSTTPTKNGSSQPAVDANFSQHSQGGETSYYDSPSQSFIRVLTTLLLIRVVTTSLLLIHSIIHLFIHLHLMYTSFALHLTDRVLTKPLPILPHSNQTSLSLYRE